MLWDIGTKNIFDTWNTTKITDITNSSTVWSIADMWIDNENKDIMIVCEVSDSRLNNYEVPFIIYDYKKADIWNLLKWNKNGTSFSSTPLQASWSWTTFTLQTTYWDHSDNEVLDIRDHNNKSLFLLHNSEKIEVKSDTSWINTLWTAYRSAWNEKSDFWANDYCMVAIR